MSEKRGEFGLGGLRIDDVVWPRYGRYLSSEAIKPRPLAASQAALLRPDMSAHSLERIASISDEIGELHPLLKRLFRKIDDIVSHEYTHGTNEFGADFILARRDHVLDTVEYVGVIAKTETIRQDHSDISRQIEECITITRVYEGKKSIILNEVWIITTGTISNNAQTVLSQKYKSTKIKFIPRDRLIRLIDKYLKEYWYELDDRIGEYLSRIQSQNEELDRRYSLAPNLKEPFYIDQDIQERNEDRYSRKSTAKRKIKREKITFWNELNNKDFLLVEGAMGSGKSKFIRHAVSTLATADKYIESRMVPVPTTFRELVDKYECDTTYALKSIMGQEQFSNMDDTATYVMFVDAIDEKRLDSDSYVKHINSIVGDARLNGRTKIVFTSRFLDDLESEAELDSDLRRLEIKPLSLSKVIAFVEKICDTVDIKGRTYEDLRKSQLFKELPRSPIAAILLAQLLNENSKDLPSNLTELYSKFTELMLGRWDLEKGLQSQKEYEALNNIVGDLASYYIDNELTAVAYSETRQMFVNYLNSRNLGLDPDELFDKLVTRSEFIFFDSKKNVIMFKHRTFAEFMMAKNMLRQELIDIDNRAFQVYWTNVMYFAIGLKKDAPDLVNKLINLEAQSESERWLKAINMSNYLLAAYATPYEHIINGLFRSIISVGELYIDIVSGKLETPLRELPQMQLLWFMQYVIRHNYSFEFFQQAVDDVALRIEYEIEDENHRMYSLYFLTVVTVEMEDSTEIGGLLEKYGNALPLDISLALYHESDSASQKSRFIKKNEKRVRSIMKSGSLREIYERPLKAIASPSV